MVNTLKVVVKFPNARMSFMDRGVSHKSTVRPTYLSTLRAGPKVARGGRHSREVGSSEEKSEANVLP